MIKDAEQSWGSFALEMAILLAIVLCVRFYVFQFFRVSGPSMCPTLNQLEGECETGKGEFVFVNQFLYHFLKDPARGEVVVFRPPTEKAYYIKRVIGVPGDTITINDGKVYLTNADHEELQLPEEYLSAENQGRTITQKKVFTVPEDHYLMFGDNRNQSLDARQWFKSCYGDLNDNTPFVHEDKIKGRAEFVIWPFWTMRWLDRPYQDL